jgi:hypothetical protein
MKMDEAAARSAHLRLDPPRSPVQTHRLPQPGAKPATGQSNSKPEEQRNIIVWSASSQWEPGNQASSQRLPILPENGCNVKYFRIFSEIFSPPPPPRSRTKTIPIRRKSAMCPGSHILIRAASIVGQPCSNRKNPWAHFQPRDFHARRRWAGRTGRQREAPGAWVARGRREQAWQRHRSDRTGPGGPQVRPTRPSAAPATSPNSKRIWISAKRCAWPVTVFESNPALRSNAWM